jgi:hypothetical protein
MKTKLILAALCIVPALAFAEERPYANGPVTAVSYIKIKPGHFDDYMRHLGGMYKKQMEAFKKAGLVIDYKVFTAPARTPQDPDLILTVTYPDMATLDKANEFDKVGAQVAGTFSEQDKAFADRGQMREVLGGLLTRELILR